MSYYNVKIWLVYFDKSCWLKQNLVEEVHQCKVMLGWVRQFFFSSRNLLIYNASKIVNFGLSELCVTEAISLSCKGYIAMLQRLYHYAAEQAGLFPTSLRA